MRARDGALTWGGESALTSLRGDGKIYVSSVEDAIRIATGERGEVAV